MSTLSKENTARMVPTLQRLTCRFICSVSNANIYIRKLSVCLINSRGRQNLYPFTVLSRGYKCWHKKVGRKVWPGLGKEQGPFPLSDSSVIDQVKLVVKP